MSPGCRDGVIYILIKTNPGLMSELVKAESTVSCADRSRGSSFAAPLCAARAASSIAPLCPSAPPAAHRLVSVPSALNPHPVSPSPERCAMNPLLLAAAGAVQIAHRGRSGDMAAPWVLVSRM